MHVRAGGLTLHGCWFPVPFDSEASALPTLADLLAMPLTLTALLYVTHITERGLHRHDLNEIMLAGPGGASRQK